MKYSIVISKAAERFLRRQDRTNQERLIKAIYRLPDKGDIVKLSGYDKYRLRVGSYRIIFSIDEVIRIINVENIDSRGDVYKRY